MGNNNPCTACTNEKKVDNINQGKKLIQKSLKPNLKPNKEIDVSPQNHQLYKSGHALIPNAKVAIKVPVQMGVKTKFKWILQNKWSYPPTIKDISPQKIKTRSFQQKAEWFRLRLQDRKTSWTQGCQNIFVDRQNLLNTSSEQLQKINITKQVKINFNDSKGENDAGGIFREWTNLCMKEIFQSKFGLMALCQTDETFYKFNVNERYVCQCINNAKVMAYLIAKALMERVPINCHLNHTIWRQLLHQRISLDDIYSYDKEFYKSWKFILQNPTEGLHLNFTTILKDEATQKSKSFDLQKDGYKKQVTQQNKQSYIVKIIQLYCMRSAAPAIQQMKKKLYEIIPVAYLSVFEPHEIDCLLCGQDSIDLQDWRANTLYDGYKQTDDIIQWFWTVMEGLQKDMLKNMLHYCTGCARVPVSGFKYLESNRGQIKQFTIRKTALDEYNPYPRSYTCFNRLQLPEYPTFDELITKLYSICSEQINQINIDA